MMGNVRSFRACTVLSTIAVVAVVGAFACVGNRPTGVAPGTGGGFDTGATGGAAGAGGATGGSPGGAFGMGGSAGQYPVEVIKSFHGDNGPFGILRASDATLWLSFRFCWDFGRLSPDGSVTLSTFVRASAPLSCTMAAGPGGVVWVGDTGALGRLTPSGELVDLPLAGGAGADGAPVGIAVDPDGNVWFTERARHYLGRMTPAGAVTEFPVPGADPGAIILGTDGNIWFREAAKNAIGRITPAGVITEFPLGGADTGTGALTPGPDGALWFAEVGAKAIGRITTAGEVTEFTAPELAPSGAITAGPDGALWFTETPVTGGPARVARLGRITPAGAVTHVPLVFPDLPSIQPFQAVGIVVGPDGNIWFTANDTFVSVVGRIVL